MCFMQKTGLKMIQYQKKEEILKCGENGHFLKILQRPWQGRIVRIGRFSVRTLDGEKEKKKQLLPRLYSFTVTLQLF